MKATASSRTLKKRRMRTGKRLIKVRIPPKVSIFQANPEIMAKRICPLVILAASRTPREMALAV